MADPKPASIDGDPPRAILLVNRDASRVDDALPRLRRHVESAAFRRALEVDLRLPDDPKTIPEIIRVEGGKFVGAIVAGGDGTLHHALPALLDADTTLGIVPLGTANDLARNLGLPLDPARAMDVIARGRVRRIDLGRANGRLFANIASAGGITGGVTHGLDAEQKRRWGVLSYPRQVLSALTGASPFRATLCVDGREEAFSAMQVSVANAPSSGGGMTLDSDTRLDDGRLTVCVIEAKSLWRLARLAPYLWAGRARSSDDAQIRTGRRVILSTSRPLDVSADGEITARTPVEFGVEPRALRVFVEEESDESLA